MGDDVYGDDPTVLELQEEAARIVGKEAAIWVNAHPHACVASMCFRNTEVQSCKRSCDAVAYQEQ